MIDVQAKPPPSTIPVPGPYRSLGPSAPAFPLPAFLLPMATGYGLIPDP